MKKLICTLTIIVIFGILGSPTMAIADDLPSLTVGEIAAARVAAERYAQKNGYPVEEYTNMAMNLFLAKKIKEVATSMGDPAEKNRLLNWVNFYESIGKIGVYSIKSQKELKEIIAEFNRFTEENDVGVPLSEELNSKIIGIAVSAYVITGYLSSASESLMKITASEIEEGCDPENIDGCIKILEIATRKFEATIDYWEKISEAINAFAKVVTARGFKI